MIFQNIDYNDDTEDLGLLEIYNWRPEKAGKTSTSKISRIRLYLKIEFRTIRSRIERKEADLLRQEWAKGITDKTLELSGTILVQ